MATFKRFEDIQAWQLGRELNREIYRLTSEGGFARDFGLRDQIRRAAISVTSNIAEGYGRRAPRDSARFLDIASGSVAEVQSQLYLALDLSYLSEDAFESTLALTRRIAGALVSLSRYLAMRRRFEKTTCPTPPTDPTINREPPTVNRQP